MPTTNGPKFRLLKGGGNGTTPDPITQARRAIVQHAGSMFDHLVGCGGRTENERTFTALLLANEWRVADNDRGTERYRRIREIGFAGDVFPAPILHDYSRHLDVVFRFPIRVGDRLFTTPFAFFSDHDVRFAVSVDDDDSSQAAQRARAFAAAGWGVYRFSDAEMRRDPDRVVCELIARLTAADWIAEAPSDPTRKADAEQSFQAEMSNYDAFKAAH